VFLTGPSWVLLFLGHIPYFNTLVVAFRVDLWTCKRSPQVGTFAPELSDFGCWGVFAQVHPRILRFPGWLVFISFLRDSLRFTRGEPPRGVPLCCVLLVPSPPFVNGFLPADSPLPSAPFFWCRLWAAGFTQECPVVVVSGPFL